MNASFMNEKCDCNGYARMLFWVELLLSTAYHEGQNSQ